MTIQEVSQAAVGVRLTLRRLLSSAKNLASARARTDEIPSPGKSGRYTDVSRPIFSRANSAKWKSKVVLPIPGKPTNSVIL